MAISISHCHHNSMTIGSDTARNTSGTSKDKTEGTIRSMECPLGIDDQRES